MPVDVSSSADSVSKPTGVVTPADALGVTKRMSQSEPDGKESCECPTCGREFDTERGMKCHHTKIHGEKIQSRVNLDCIKCGQSFEVKPYREDTAKYCSQACRNTKVDRVCEYCDSTYSIPESRNSISRFCSNECNSKWMSENLTGEDNPNGKPKAVLECRECGDEYKVKQSEKERSKYCSNHCKWVNIGSRVETGKATVDCIECESEFEVRDGRKASAKFCSYGCMGEWRSDNFVGDGNPAWKGGSVLYGRGWNVKKRRQVRIRDQARCQYCGLSEAEHFDKYGRKLEVHHIIPARQFEDAEKRNSMENLETLCMTCHRELEKFAPLRPDTANVSTD